MPNPNILQADGPADHREAAKQVQAQKSRKQNAASQQSRAEQIRHHLVYRYLAFDFRHVVEKSGRPFACNSRKMLFRYPVFTSILLSFVMASHNASPIPWRTDMNKIPTLDILSSSQIDDDDEFTRKVLSAAQPLHVWNQSSHRRGQSYNQDDDTTLAEGFDMSLYSLKYAGCSVISTFSDSLAQDASAKTVFKTIENVVFRLCPRNTCYDWTVYGCLYDYGQYIIRLDTWMQLISTYREEKLYQYCQICKQCMSSGEGGGYNRNLLRFHDTGSVSPMSHFSRDVAGENDNEKENGDEINCDNYSSACSDYMDMCEYVVHDPYEYSKYFSCTAVTVDNGSTIYLGPHCLSDKATIVIGVFADNQCSEYIGGNYDVYSLSGINFDLSEYYQTKCYSCEQQYGSSNRRLGEDHEQNQENQDGQQNTNGNEACTNLYTYAGKCNKFFVDSSDQQQSYYSDGTNDHLMCHYIDSVATGAYDEHGFIYIDAGKYKKDNRVNEYASYAPITWEVTFSQIVGLLFLSFCLLSLMILNLYLYRRVQRKTTWMIPEDKMVPILWRESGIGNMRSDDDESVNHVFI